jgi:hypothetical protein
MSDDTQPPSSVPPPSPLGKTQAVPLKKETVRITLRAKPGEGGESALPPAPAPAPPTAPLRPAAPPPAVSRPVAPPPPGGASRTIPLSKAPAPAPPVAPGAAPAPALAPTRPMTAPIAAAPQAAPGPRPTVRLQPQPGVPAIGAVSSAPLKPAAMDDDEEESNESGLGLLAGIATGLAALLLLVTALSSDKFKLGVSLDQNNSGWKLPRASTPKENFATQEATGSWSTALELPEIPQYQAPN